MGLFELFTSYKNRQQATFVDVSAKVFEVANFDLLVLYVKKRPYYRARNFGKPLPLGWLHYKYSKNLGNICKVFFMITKKTYRK